MAAIPVRFELRTPLPVAVNKLDALERVLTAAMKAHGVPVSEATMRQDGTDLVMFYDFTTPGPSEDDDYA
jgi:hypothetical protein